MFNRASVRRLLVAAGIGLALIGAPGLAAADPGDDEVPMPGLVTAAASCEQGSAVVKVWIEDEGDASPAVRLERVSPDTATLTKDTVADPETDGMRIAVFEPVPVGEYNVHIDRGRDVRPDDLPVSVKSCADAQPTDELLRVRVECQAGWAIVTYQIVNPQNGKSTTYVLNVAGAGGDVVTADLDPGLSLEVTENAYDDGDYIAKLQLNDSPKPKDRTVVARKEFTVNCREGHTPTLTVTTTCSGTTGTATVGVLNPNRVPVNYEVSLKDVTKKLTLNGGEKGTVAFDGIAVGEHPVVVTGADQTEARGTAKLDCGGTSTTTTTTTTTTTPAPQGRSDSGLANTGASVGGLVGLGALGLALGGALLMIGRRRAHGNR